MRLALQRHRCVSLLPLAQTAWRRLDDFFTVEARSADDDLPPDTAALIVPSCALGRLPAQRLPAALRSVTVVGRTVPDDFLHRLGRRSILVTWPNVAGADRDAEAMEVCQDVLAAFGFGRMGARPRNVLNDELLCDCC